MNLVKLFLLSILLGGVGGAAGGALGTNLGAGGLLVGGLLVGIACLVAAGWLSARWRWIERTQRIWSILGAAFGFLLAWMVTLATIAQPGALLASTLLVGTGAVLGAIVGRSPRLDPGTKS
jgi:hypothetical protein